MRFALSMLIVVAGVCLSPLEAYAQGVDIKVVQWNVEDGEQAGEITAIVAQRPAVVFLQEVDRVAHLDSIVAALEADQPGTDWHQRNIERHNSTTGASFLAILARFPISNVKTKLLTADNEVIPACPGHPTLAARAAIGATITVNGQPLAVFSTRNQFVSGDCIAAEQNRRFKSWANTNYSNATHLYGGDFNMVPNGQAYLVMTQDPPVSIDAWKEALDKGTATAADDSTPDFFTPTRNSRLDYLFYKNADPVLSVKSAHITTRDLTLSDHRMMTSIFTVGTSTLPTDDFNDNSLDTTKWSIGVWSGSTQDTTIRVAERNTRLEIGPLKEGTTGNHYNALRSAGSHNFSGAYAYVQLVQPAATTTGAFSMFSVGRDASNYYRWYVSAGRLVAEKEIGGSKTTLVDIGYNAVGHQFLRVCHDSSTGSVVFQTAPNSGGVPGAWFQHHAEAWNATAVPLTTMLFEMKAGTSAAEIAPGTAAYDNFRAARVANCQ